MWSLTVKLVSQHDDGLIPLLTFIWNDPTSSFPTAPPRVQKWRSATPESIFPYKFSELMLKHKSAWTHMQQVELLRRVPG